MKHRMEFLPFKQSDSRVTAAISRFRGANGTDEYHVTLQPVEPASFHVQAGWLINAYNEILDFLDIGIGTSVFRRFFCSKLPNQDGTLANDPLAGINTIDTPCFTSLVCQPPGHPAKIALWAYHVCDRHDAAAEKTGGGNSMSLRRGKLTHYWTGGMTCTAHQTTREQTETLLAQYTAFLKTQGMSLADNVIRTWFFLPDIDIDYKGFAEARKDFFAAHGLTHKTHFIASTAVGDSNTHLAAKVTMDAYAISGLEPGQIGYLSALEYLSPTYVYGVTFERGTCVSYGDRKHIVLSGTASIDKEGNILHHGDVLRQLDRTVENMEALMGHAGADLKDMGIFIAYVRNPADNDIVSKNLAQRFTNIPVITVLAPVCRPGWLVEIEGMAIIPSRDDKFPAF